MFLSMHNWMRAEKIEVTIRRLAQAGYDSIEIEGEPEKYDTQAVRSLLKENGIFCFGSVSLMFEGRDLIHADEAVRTSSVQYIKDCVTMVKELEGREMTIVPSQVGKISPMDTPEQEWAWAVEGLKEIYDHSEKAGVVLGLEPLNRFETNFLSRHDQALLLAEAVGPNCGVCLDAFHINIEEADLYQAILNTGAKLVAFHVDRDVVRGHAIDLHADFRVSHEFVIPAAGPVVGGNVNVTFGRLEPCQSPFVEIA